MKSQLQAHSRATVQLQTSHGVQNSSSPHHAGDVQLCSLIAIIDLICLKYQAEQADLESLVPHSLCSFPEGVLLRAQSSLSCFTTLYGLDDVVWFVASCKVIPHLKIKPLQFHCILLCVEQGTGYSLLPDLATYFLQVF